MRQQEVEIEKMTQIQAVEIADTWKHEGIYKFYDMAEDPEDYDEITDSVLRGDRYWSVLDGEKLIGFFCLEPKDETVELGLGLKPKYTGKGFGIGYQNDLKNRYIHVDYEANSQSAIQSVKTEVSKCKNCTLEELAILKIQKKNPSVTQKELAKALGKSERTIKTRTVEMQNKGLVRRENGKRNGRWEVLIEVE